MKTKMTRKELIDYIATNNGFGPEVTEQFTTEVLQTAVDDPQGAYIYIKAILELSKPSGNND